MIFFTLRSRLFNETQMLSAGYSLTSGFSPTSRIVLQGKRREASTTFEYRFCVHADLKSPFEFEAVSGIGRMLAGAAQMRRIFYFILGIMFDKKFSGGMIQRVWWRGRRGTL